MRYLSFIILLLIIFFGISFAVLNSETVKINYYLGQNTLPLSLLVVFVFSGGCLLGLLTGLIMLVKTKLTTHRLRQRLTLAEKEIENLRAIPLQDKV